MCDRETLNAARAADAARRLDYGALGLARGVDGSARVDMGSRDGLLCPPVPTLVGAAWPLFCSEVAWAGDWAFPPPGLAAESVAQFDRARVILSQLVAMLTDPAFHGAAWVQLHGAAGRLWYAHKRGEGYEVAPTLFPVARRGCVV
jgi:hypothetical protein